ncbi:hypothetical protein CDD82_2922 [Ophiocordyceps australis]|uniref:Ecp2 effector protein domain-containing protein n=1 Tax=Ophiocordyceps australis TaxID=1399860 RepID=A0A2C5ZFT4_9HYPO|nr:hypothetical protein CDD82_2922 [Ophiocordyceps australis]
MAIKTPPLSILLGLCLLMAVQLAQGRNTIVQNLNNVNMANMTGISLVNNTSPLPTSVPAQPRPYPIPAHGGPEEVPARVAMRCRFAYINNKRNPKVYRIFMGPRNDTDMAQDWCDKFRTSLRTHCINVLANRVPVTWLRCDKNGKDLLWEQGSIASFMAHIRWERKPTCIHKALVDSTVGYLIDWQAEVGCYQTFSHEIEI